MLYRESHKDQQKKARDVDEAPELQKRKRKSQKYNNC
jgi:hypothetical protein